MTLTPQLSSFQFHNYRLLKILFELNSGFVLPESDEGLSYELTLASLVSEQPSNTDTDDGLHSLVRIDVSIVWSQENNPFKLEAACEGEFSCPSSMDKEQYKGLCDLHAPALLYTQLRPLVRMIASESGDAFMLPLINIAETLKQSRERLKEQAALPEK